MPKAYLAAKEKYQAVIDDPGRGDYYCRTNRYAAAGYPSSGPSHDTNKVDHTDRRRTSSSSTFREKWKDWMNKPAF